MSKKKVVVLLQCNDAEINQRRAMRFFHDRGIEGKMGTTKDGVLYVEFDVPEDETILIKLRTDFARFMNGRFDI